MGNALQQAVNAGQANGEGAPSARDMIVPIIDLMEKMHENGQCLGSGDIPYDFDAMRAEAATIECDGLDDCFLDFRGPPGENGEPAPVPSQADVVADMLNAINILSDEEVEQAAQLGANLAQEPLVHDLLGQFSQVAKNKQVAAFRTIQLEIMTDLMFRTRIQLFMNHLAQQELGDVNNDHSMDSVNRAVWNDIWSKDLPPNAPAPEFEELTQAHIDQIALYM